MSAPPDLRVEAPHVTLACREAAAMTSATLARAAADGWDAGMRAAAALSAFDDTLALARRLHASARPEAAAEVRDALLRGDLMCQCWLAHADPWLPALAHALRRRGGGGEDSGADGGACACVWTPVPPQLGTPWPCPQAIHLSPRAMERVRRLVDVVCAWFVRAACAAYAAATGARVCDGGAPRAPSCFDAPLGGWSVRFPSHRAWALFVAAGLARVHDEIHTDAAETTPRVVHVVDDPALERRAFLFAHEVGSAAAPSSEDASWR